MAKKKQKNNIWLKVIIASSLIAGIGVGSYFLIKNVVSNEATEENNNEPIKLKMLSETQLEDGTIRKVLNYTIVPEDATNKEVKVTAEYEDGSLCDDVVSCWSNVTNLQIGLDFKSDFDKKIIVTVSSTFDESIKTTITCDYEKDLINFSVKKDEKYNQGKYDISGGKFGYNDDNLIDSFNINNFIDITYSKYTLDKEYTFKLELDLFSTTLEENYDKIIEIDGFDKYSNVYKVFNGELSELVKTKLLNMSSLPTAEEIWNVSTQYTDEWRNYLLDTSINVSWFYAIHGTFRAFDGDNELFSAVIGELPTMDDFYLEYDLSNLDFSSFEIPVEEVNIENNHIII